MKVNVRIDFSNDSGDSGILRGSLELAAVPSVGSEVRVRRGGRFYYVEQTLFSENGPTINLGKHNLSATTVAGLVAKGWRKSRV